MNREPKDKNKITLITPAFNEEDNIRIITQSGVQLEKEGIVDYFYVFDDGSTDQTADIAKQIGANVISMTANFGKSRTVLHGMLQAKKNGSDILITIDADLLNHLDGNHIKNFVDTINGNNDYGIPVDVAVYPALEYPPKDRTQGPFPKYNIDSHYYSGNRAFWLPRFNFLFIEKNGTFEFAKSKPAQRYLSLAGYGFETAVNRDAFCVDVENYVGYPLIFQEAMRKGIDIQEKQIRETRQAYRERERKYEQILRIWYKNGKHKNFVKNFESESGMFKPLLRRFGSTKPIKN